MTHLWASLSVLDLEICLMIVAFAGAWHFRQQEGQTVQVMACLEV